MEDTRYDPIDIKSELNQNKSIKVNIKWNTCSTHAWQNGAKIESVEIGIHDNACPTFNLEATG